MILLTHINKKLPDPIASMFRYCTSTNRRTTQHFAVPFASTNYRLFALSCSAPKIWNTVRGVTTLKKWYGTPVRVALLGKGRHCLKGRPCRNARYWRYNTALGLRDAEDRLPIGRHVKYDSIENESLYRFHLNAGRFFRVQFIWYCGHWWTDENPNIYYYLVTPFRPSVRPCPATKWYRFIIQKQ